MAIDGMGTTAAETTEMLAAATDYPMWEAQMTAAGVAPHWIQAFSGMWLKKDKPASENPTYKGMKALIAAFYASKGAIFSPQ